MKLKLSGSFLPLFLIAATVGFSSAAKATTISGELNITGAVRVTATEIDFLPAGGGDGQFTVQEFVNTGSFAGLDNTTGSSKDLDITVQPVGVPFFLANFLTFTANPALHFDLTFIEPGSFTAAQCGVPAAAGQSCTPAANSPFNLANQTASSSVASFAVRGTVDDGGQVSNFIGTFTTQFSGQSYQQVLASLATNGFVQASYSANFIATPIPEPGTTSLFVIAGALLSSGAFLRKRISRQ